MATVPHQFEKGHERIFMLNRKIECTTGIEVGKSQRDLKILRDC